MDQFFETSKSGPYYGWIDLILTGLLPVTCVEIRKVRVHVKHDNMSLTTFMGMMKKLEQYVERKVAAFQLKSLHL